MRKILFFIGVVFFCSVLCWGQTWKLTETMTAVLDDKGVLTISTTASSEEMPVFWYDEILLEDGTILVEPVTPWLTEGYFPVLSVVISEKVTTIGKYALGFCYDLVSASISGSVTKIGEGAFEGCTNLTSIAIPESVTDIESSAFSGCGLTSISIPKSVTRIESYTFFYCTNLTSITFPNTLTHIGLGAFFHCINLTTFTIPKSVTSIGRGALNSCTGLKDVTVEWTTPLIVDEIFANVNKSEATLHVPSGTKALYQAANVWKEFNPIVEYVPTHTELVEVPKLKTYASNGVLYINGLRIGKLLSIYSINGQFVYQGVAKAENERITLNTQGVYIVVSENQTIKAIVK